MIDWCAPPSGARVYPGRRPDQDRLAAGVDAERPGFERALHERVVQDADRQQRLAPAAPGGAELADCADEVGLGDAEFDVLPGRLLAPVQDRLGVVGEPVAPVLVRPDAHLVDPAAEVGRGGHVRADRDDPPAHLGGRAVEVEQGTAQCRLGGRRARGRAAEIAGHGGNGRRDRGGAPEPARGVGEQRGGRAAGLEHRPGIGRVGSQPRGQVVQLRFAQQRGVVLRMALGRQPVALEGVGQDHRRAGVVDLPERFPQRGQVVAAEVADRCRQGGVGHVGDQRGDVCGPRAVVGQRGADVGWRPAQQPLVFGVGHLVDAVAQRAAAGAAEQLLQQPAVLDGEHLPAGGGEHALQPGSAHCRQDAVQGLPVEVDDPHHFAELGHHRVEYRLPDGALVEFGVPDQRPLPAGVAGAELGADVPAGDRAPDRCRRADADAAGRVVRGDRVFEAARVGLQSAELPQRSQVLRVKLAEQVLQCVQHRGGVRLDADAVLGGELLQPQRRHDRHDGRAGGLVTADLQAGGVGAHPGWRGRRSPWPARAPGPRPRAVPGRARCRCWSGWW